jgi:hypothetical protein
MSGRSRSGGDGTAARDALVGRQRRSVLDVADEKIERTLRVQHAGRAFGKAHSFAYDARSIPQRRLQSLQIDQEET